VFFAGALVGTLVPGAVKVSAVTRLPLTGTFGWSHGGMGFASMMKWAGYDGLVVTGRAESPVYIKIADQDVAICDARRIWGKDTIETTTELKKGNEDASVLSIGQAGENLVKMSLGMIDYTSTLGQGGLGAVMGSKKLKAIVVYGSQGVTVADKKGFLKAVRDLKKRFMDFQHREIVTGLGMMAGWKMLLKGYFCTEYMTPEEITNIYGVERYQEAKQKTLSCPGCLVGDKEVIQIREGRFGSFNVPATSYPEIPSLGTAFGIKNLSEAAYLYDRCNRLGISCQTLEGFLSFVITLYENGVISREDCEGLDLKRNFETVNRLLEIISSRHGIGDTLADGWEGMISRFGERCREYALINKGSNFIWDPRLNVLGTLEFEQIISPKGPYSAFGGSPTTVPNLEINAFRRHCDRVGANEEQIQRIFDSPLGFNIGKITCCFENWVTLLSCLGICNRASNDRYYSAALCADLYRAATGFDVGRDEMVGAAERAWTMARVINVREDFTRKDDAIPEEWFEPFRTADGKEHMLQDYYKQKVLTREDLTGFLDDYYEERDWDKESGIPKAEKLLELGLNELIGDIQT
jgi:aldehyde:ferredoxin oxidoreductase